MGDKEGASILQRRPLPKKVDGGNDWFTNLLSVKTSLRRLKKCDYDDKKRHVEARKKVFKAQHNGAENQELTNCLKPLGPNPFPQSQRSLRKPPPWQFSKKNLIGDDDATLYIDQAQILLSMLQAENRNKRFLEDKVSHKTDNYVKHNDSEEKVLHILNLHEEESLPEIAARKPWRQYLLEKQQNDNSNVLPGTTEIIYTDAEESFSQHVTISRHIHESEYTNSSTNRNQTLEDRLSGYEHNYKLSNDSPQLYNSRKSSLKLQYDNGSIEEITASLGRENDFGDGDSFIDNKATKLNLKAYFLDLLPDLPFTVFQSLAWINLSFNDFEFIPEQLFHAKNVVYLNMRNNPLTVIPEGIKKLTKLRYLNVSFCCLTSLDQRVFSLNELEILDISYNHISSIGYDIKNLCLLKEFYLDGNYVEYFPTSLLRLKLIVLSCNGNFTNKLFWKESFAAAPQRLVDMAATIVARNVQQNLPNQLENVTFSTCDYCSEVMACDGISVVKPVSQLFGITNLPILFHVCTQTCKTQLLLAAQLPMSDLM